MIPESVPKKFQQTVSEVYGERGVQWLRGLPDLIADCEGRWDLRVLAPFELSYNYVTPAVRSDGMPVILKLGVPNPELTSEIQALQCFDGRGAARLLEGYPRREGETFVFRGEMTAKSTGVVWQFEQRIEPVGQGVRVVYVAAQ